MATPPPSSQAKKNPTPARLEKVEDKKIMEESFSSALNESKLLKSINETLKNLLTVSLNDIKTPKTVTKKDDTSLINLEKNIEKLISTISENNKPDKTVVDKSKDEISEEDLLKELKNIHKTLRVINKNTAPKKTVSGNDDVKTLLSNKELIEKLISALDNKLEKSESKEDKKSESSQFTTGSISERLFGKDNNSKLSKYMTKNFETFRKDLEKTEDAKSTEKKTDESKKPEEPKVEESTNVKPPKKGKKSKDESVQKVEAKEKTTEAIAKPDVKPSEVKPINSSVDDFSKEMADSEAEQNIKRTAEFDSTVISLIKENNKISTEQLDQAKILNTNVQKLMEALDADFKQITDKLDNLPSGGDDGGLDASDLIPGRKTLKTLGRAAKGAARGVMKAGKAVANVGRAAIVGLGQSVGAASAGAIAGTVVAGAAIGVATGRGMVAAYNKSTGGDWDDDLSNVMRDNTPATDLARFGVEKGVVKDPWGPGDWEIPDKAKFLKVFNNPTDLYSLAESDKFGEEDKKWIHSEAMKLSQAQIDKKKAKPTKAAQVWDNTQPTLLKDLPMSTNKDIGASNTTLPIPMNLEPTPVTATSVTAGIPEVSDIKPAETVSPSTDIKTMENTDVSSLSAEMNKEKATTVVTTENASNKIAEAATKIAEQTDNSTNVAPVNDNKESVEQLKVISKHLSEISQKTMPTITTSAPIDLAPYGDNKTKYIDAKR